MCVWVGACAYVHVALLIHHATHMRHIVTSFMIFLLHHIFRHYLITGTISEKVIEHKMCVLIFSTIFVLTILRRIPRDIVINVKTSSWYSCRILIELEFSRQIFEKRSNIKFYENPSSGSRVVPCGRTD